MAIKVIAAVYGTTTNGSDVTEIVQKRLDTGNDDVLIDNDDMGGDPDPGVVKQFGILYSLPDGSICARCAVEGDKLELID
jgi:hypothetical protein